MSISSLILLKKKTPDIWPLKVELWLSVKSKSDTKEFVHMVGTVSSYRYLGLFVH